MMLMLAGMALIARAAEEPVSADQLKAAFLYNFVRYTEWPTNSAAIDSTPITIGVAGDDNFAALLASLLKDKKAHNRPMSVRKVTSANEAAACDVVFVAHTENRKASQFVEAAGRRPVLLIGEADEFLSVGGMINIVPDEKQKQLRFDVNPKAAEDANLLISSHLIKLARKTKTPGSVR